MTITVDEVCGGPICSFEVRIMLSCLLYEVGYRRSGQWQRLRLVWGLWRAQAFVDRAHRIYYWGVKDGKSGHIMLVEEITAAAIMARSLTV